MNTMTAKSTLLTASIGLALAATVTATSVTAADRISILDDAIFDYTDRGPSTVNSSGGENDINIVLNQSEYDYTPISPDIERYLEVAEIAAFEEESGEEPRVFVEPDDLKVWD